MFIKYNISTFDDFPVLFIPKLVAKFLITIANEKTYFKLCIKFTMSIRINMNIRNTTKNF